MESNNLGSTEPQPDQPPNGVDVVDWRPGLTRDNRIRILNKIMEGLKRNFPFSGQEGLLEVKKIAIRFEEKIHKAAISQSDYLRRISMKLLAMENSPRNNTSSSLGTNPASGSRNPTEPVPQNMQVQGYNQGQAISMPLSANQSQGPQQMLTQNGPANIASVGVQSSAGLASTPPSVSGMNDSPISNVISQSSNMQNMADASQNMVGNAMGQGVASNVFNNQKQVPGRQQVPPGQQQFQQQFMYQQQPQQQFIKQKQVQQGIIPNSLVQSHIQQKQRQQQNLQQPNQIQSSQQAGISTSNAMLQKHPQSVLRQQQQPQQTPVQHQQQMTHQSTMSSLPQQQLQRSQPQQPLMGHHQTNTKNMQPTQLLVKQTISDMPLQPQRLMTQQNNISNLQRQQLIVQQTNLTNIRQHHMGHEGTVSGQQQHLNGNQSSNLSVQDNQHQMHTVNQNKGAVPQQNQQPTTILLANQGQHSQLSQPHIMSQNQSQSAQLQQPLGMNQQQQDMQQRLPPSGTLMQPHNTGDQQKQMYQSQRVQPEASSTSTDSVSQTGQANSANWREEVYRKITSLKESYFIDINKLYQKISLRLEQYARQHGSIHPKPEPLERLKSLKSLLEGFMSFLHVGKSNVSPAHREKLPDIEKQIVNVLNSLRSQRSGHVPPPMQQAQRQNLQTRPHDENYTNPSLQPANIQNPVMMQQNSTSLQQNPISSSSELLNVQQNMSGSVQPGPSVDAGQGGGLASVQQGIGVTLQQNLVDAPQQTNMNALSTRNGVNLIQPNISDRHSNSSVNQQHVEEQQMSQQFKQFQQRQMQKQMIQKQQLLPQSKQQQQVGQMSAHQLPQRQQMADVNGMNIREGLGVKPGVFQQHHATAAGQRYIYSQQIKSGVSFPMSSPQMLSTTSSQVLLNSSPQIDQQNMTSSLSKAGTPLQSANSPFVVPSPSTPLAPSPVRGDSEKLTSYVSPFTTSGNIGVQQSALPQAPTEPMAIGTPGISASPLLAESSNQDAAHGTPSDIVTKSSITDQPLDRLIKAVKSISNEALTASVNDIGSVVSMIDRISGSAPGNGSRAAVGEDMVAMTKRRLQVGNFATKDGISGSKKMKQFTSSMPLVVVSTNDSFKQLVCSELSDLESTATSRAKRPRIEVNHSLQKEIREINQRLIDTMVDISDEGVNLSAAAASECSGVIVKCSYNAVALSPDLKSQYATAQLSPIQPLRLLVPSNYPNSSPVLLDKIPVNVSNENEDLSMKAKSRFSISLRTLSEPLSLGEIARTWDFCARTVISEYVQARGGGSFSSRYGRWESVLSN
ncbi:hypothetical protein QQ045_019514 [Rhodiola kirilowii]